MRGERTISENEMLYRLKYYTRINKKGCWIWTRARDIKEGYGVIKWGYTTYRAHRLMYMLMFPWRYDSKLIICHSCDNPACINWGHLWQGTQSENIQDSWNKNRQVGNRR